MNYADIIWKLVERLLDEKEKQESTKNQSNKEQTED